MAPSTYLPAGVDLGQGGGLVVLDGATVVDHFYIPKLKIGIKYLRAPKSKAKSKERQEIYDTVSLIERIKEANAKAMNLGYAGIFVVLEDFQTRPGKNNPLSYISTGGCLQAWKNSLTQANVPFVMVSPVTWKPNLGLSSDKKLSLKEVKRLFLNAPKDLLEDHNIAEAALLAYWLETFHSTKLVEEHE